MSFLVQLLLPPLSGTVPLTSSQFAEVRSELMAEFGGITVYSQSPADGLWESNAGVVEQDEMVLFEVMTKTLRPHWWKNYRRVLERRFQQTEIVVRAHRIRRL